MMTHALGGRVRALFALLVLAPSFAVGRVIRSVAIDHPSVNVAAGEIVTLTAEFALPGAASVSVLDRDGYVVRHLVTAQPVRSGHVSWGWDARDDQGKIVPDEAYSLLIRWQGKDGVETYLPASAPGPMTTIRAEAYDRRSGTLSYGLRRPSRVHVQAGTALLDPATHELLGPVMKTIVNREPRAGGMIAEHWPGYDESGTIFVPDLEGFVVAIAATPLPENAVITFGNRQRSFVETIATRAGHSVLPARTQHEHHAGLRTQDDLSPRLQIEPLNARWSADERQWVAPQKTVLQLRLAVAGPTAAAFRTHPATIELFIDGKRLGAAVPKRGDIVTLPLDEHASTHHVSVNWNSEWGPVAANTITVRVGGAR